MKRLFLLMVSAIVVVPACQKELPTPPLPNNNNEHHLDGVIAYYSFSGNTKDDSKNGNDAENHGAKLVADRFGKPNSAYYFDGDSAFIQCPSLSKLDNTNTMTISLWAKSIGLNSNTNCAYGCSQFLLSRGADTEDGHFVMALSEVPDSNRFAACINSNFVPNPGIVLSRDLFLIPQNTWHNVIMTYDSQIIELYVDGILQSATIYNKPLIPNHSPVYIGKNVGYFFTYCTKGYIDDVIIWNRGLTENEVQKVYNCK